MRGGGVDFTVTRAPSGATGEADGGSEAGGARTAWTQFLCPEKTHSHSPS